jgi:hypothetical protein
MTAEREQRAVPGGVPRVAALISAVSLFGIVAAALTALAITNRLDGRSTPLLVTLIGTVASTVPAIMSAVFSERVMRDVRNGVLEDKARAGAVEAIRAEGVVTRNGPYADVTSRALLDLMAAVHAQGASHGHDVAAGHTDPDNPYDPLPTTNPGRHRGQTESE